MSARRPGVRALTTSAATAAVALVLVVAAVILTTLLHKEVASGVDAALRARAVDVAALVGTGDMPSVIPSGQDEGSLVQVLDRAGRVVSATANIEGEAAIARTSARAGLSTEVGLPIGSGERYRVLVQPVESTGSGPVVVVARSLASADLAVNSAQRLMIQAFPFVLLLTAAVTWLGVGRALAPVERIRRKVATIEIGDLSESVPLPRARDEIYRLARTMNSMLGRLHASTERQRRFVADASHELRSPLAGMRASLELARAQDDLELWRETGAELHDEYVRMERLVEDLLLLARLDGQVALTRHLVDLDEIVHAGAQQLRRHGDVRVQVQPLPALQALGDAAQLGRVLQNLMENAARHAESVVSVSMFRVDEGVAVRVANDGPAVPVEQQERIFDRFTRLDQARARDHGGSGLGLAISRGIAQAHGGSLSLLRPTGPVGAVFELRLPLAAGSRAGDLQP